MAKKKKEPEKKVVRFERFEPFRPPHEGEYYQLLVYRKPEYPYKEYPYNLVLHDREPQWDVVREAADILDLVEEHDRQRKVYAKVQIRKVNREVIVGAE